MGDGARVGNGIISVDAIVAQYKASAKKGERLGKMIERTGLDPFTALAG